MTHAPLVRLLANVIMNGNEEIFQFTPDVLPPTTLNFNSSNQNSFEEDEERSQHSERSSVVDMEQSPSVNNLSAVKSDSDNDEGQVNTSVICTSSSMNNRIINASPTPSSSKQFVAALEASISTNLENLSDMTKRPFLASVYESLSTEENDYGEIGRASCRERV